MKHFIQSSFAMILGALVLMPLSSHAMSIKSKPVAVAELFTSQGCSSCPPADDFLTELSKRDDVITLAYHVDYWNYIGWKDTFSAKKHSDLQRKYAHRNGHEQIYTPQLVLNGDKDYVGSKRGVINAAIEKSTLPISLQFGLDDDVLNIDIPTQESDIKEGILWLVSFRQMADVDIQRGENRGKKLSYSSIVYERQIVGMWYANKNTQMIMPVPEMLADEIDGLALLLQEKSADGLPGRILGAAALTR